MKSLKFSLLAIVLIILVIGYFFLFGDYSKGFRAGTVIKLSEKGIVFKTYEGQLNMGMVVTDNAAASATNNLWSFSVEKNPELIKSLENAMLSGHRVKLNYKEKYLGFPWVGDTKYVVYGVEVNP